ncbi:neural Wiskott-Aldrich syndrome protein [Esox lucius]|uniref:neural Wiskott-Aldrich syndrome protein n=1 Tax=Esox lucius TaxID=8010 RepID=UPI001476F5FD|nr:neural Wiskott-Aldrich syndrome protein [Esox lucius]XP_034143312.1 neural Wiskott-Aldrich syndrome protein [Esox lucius]
MTYCSQNGSPVFSHLLTVRENALLFTLLGAQCKTVASAVAQVYLSVPGHQGWRNVGCGVVCLVKDCSQHSYFLRLYCVKRAKLLWEQELYVQFQYSAPRPYFHTFPADDGQAGLNFTDEAEAQRFSTSVETLIKQSSDLSSGQLNHSDRVDSSDCVREQEQSRSGISTPSSYVSEKGWKVDQGQSLSSCELDPGLRKWIMDTGLNEGDMTDRHNSKVMCNIIDDLWGLEAVTRDMKNRGAASKTLPNRSTRTSISLALRKGPLPPLPSPLTRSASSRDVSKSPLPSWVPAPPSVPAPPPPAEAFHERLSKSSSFSMVCSPSAINTDLGLTVLRGKFQMSHCRPTS